jgi:very-short-patch-repair endonuclease
VQNLYMPVRRSVALEERRLSRRTIDREYVRVYPDVYLHKDVPLDAVVRAHAAWSWSGGRGVLAGWSAAAFWGTRWIDANTPACINVAEHRRAPAGLTIYRDELDTKDVVNRRSCAITTPERTAYDLGRRLEFDAAIEVIDAIYQATRLTRSGFSSYVDGHSGDRGLAQLRNVIALSDEGAESKWETRTRLAIRREGFPDLETQVVIQDPSGRFIGRADMGWRRWRVVVEYEGDHHFDKIARNNDIERWNALEAAGWRVIRVKAKQLTHGRALLMQQIRTVLRERGADT